MGNLITNATDNYKDWQPAHTFYCVCCAHILVPGKGPLLCEHCAGLAGMRIGFCNLCGAPMPPHSGATTAHDICVRKRFKIQ